jgi:hypothetical protein
MSAPLSEQPFIASVAEPASGRASIAVIVIVIGMADVRAAKRFAKLDFLAAQMPSLKRPRITATCSDDTRRTTPRVWRAASRPWTHSANVYCKTLRQLAAEGRLRFEVMHTEVPDFSARDDSALRLNDIVADWARTIWP